MARKPREQVLCEVSGQCSASLPLRDGTTHVNRRSQDRGMLMDMAVARGKIRFHHPLVFLVEVPSRMVFEASDRLQC